MISRILKIFHSQLFHIPSTNPRVLLICFVHCTACLAVLTGLSNPETKANAIYRCETNFVINQVVIWFAIMLVVLL